MSELPTDDKTSDDVPASIAQVVPTEHPHLGWMKKEIAEEVNRQVSNGSDSNMSDATISKDWVERKTSEIESKIEIDRVKSDARFEKLISDSDIKFEKLLGEMNTKFAMSESRIVQVESTHTKWMVGLVFSFIAFTLAAIGFSTNLILRAIPSVQQTQALSGAPAAVIVDKQQQQVPQKETLPQSEKPKI